MWQKEGVNSYCRKSIHTYSFVLYLSGLPNFVGLACKYSMLDCIWNSKITLLLSIESRFELKSCSIQFRANLKFFSNFIYLGRLDTYETCKIAREENGRGPKPGEENYPSGGWWMVQCDGTGWCKPCSTRNQVYVHRCGQCEASKDAPCTGTGKEKNLKTFKYIPVYFEERDSEDFLIHLYIFLGSILLETFRTFCILRRKRIH